MMLGSSYIPSISSQRIIEQIEIIQELVSSERSKLNHPVMNKKRDQIQFSPGKRP